jgi:sterol desaturase/sphingolipid hydroxylase (fatty acid hydroxylase superfamily)
VAKQYVSNRDESIRIFQSDTLEWLTRVHPAVPHAIYLPVIVLSLWGSHAAGLSLTRMGLAFAAGLLLWTLVEYVIHRFMFHAAPELETEVQRIVNEVPLGTPVFSRLRSWKQRHYFLAHGVHHDFPSDARRLVMPPVTSVPLAIVFFLLFRLAFGAAFGPASFAGFVLGYLAYDTIHFLVHHTTPRSRVLLYLKKKHYRHHYGDSLRDYGVSTPLWDFLFGTAGRGRRASRPAETH